MTPVRAALHPVGPHGWRAGRHYLRNLEANVRASSRSREIELVEVPRDETLQRSPVAIANRIVRRLAAVDLQHAWRMRRQQVDVALLPTATARLPGVDIVSWVPDLQHIAMPDMFDRDERRDRDWMFGRSAVVSDLVLLPSDHAAGMFRSTFDVRGGLVLAWHPRAVFGPGVYVGDPHEITLRYGLPGRFVFCPNQFWRHKGHDVAFEAVARAHAAGADVVLVCSGGENDYRHPEYVAELDALIDRLGIRSAVVRLGVIPYPDLLQLMRASLCVLNPSRFEGFGMTVNEADALGARVIVSDLAPHREQDVPDARYFAAGDSASLAEALLEAWSTWDAGPAHEREARARDRASRLASDAGDRFVEAIVDLVRSA